jgi:ATP-dependent exoDNAse (exonuclease V) beta subunit
MMTTARGIDFINASAGSGKTHRLTEEVVEALKKGSAPESLLVTTFTNKAAAELRERIRRRLLRQNMPDEALRVLDGFIGTINSVCARLLKEYALEAGLSPALDVLPEEERESLFKTAVAGVAAELVETTEAAAGRLQRAGWTEDARRVLDLARMNRVAPEQLRAWAKDSWEALKALFDEAEFSFSSVSGEGLGEGLDEELDEAVADAAEGVKAIESPAKTTLAALEELKKFQDRREKFLHGGPEVPWSEWVRLSKLKAAKDGDSCLERVRVVAGSVLAHPLFRDDVRRMVEGVFACAADALALYENHKRKLGLMDFADQEIKVLELLDGGNKAFEDSMKDRLSRVMVDEFQDTNPIQLALFLALHALTARSTWVGDPKQAIYGFRGTDAQLMDEVNALIEKPRILEFSWRSKELLVRFCNAVYSRVFREMGEERVRLKIPPERAREASGGELELWRLSSKNAAGEALALAAGVRDLLGSGVEPGGVAVLCRTNEQCEAVARELEALNVRASVSQGSLLTTPECRLALAALRYTLDEEDTLALAEIACLSPLHSGHETWLSSLVESSGEALSRWRQDPFVTGLSAARGRLKYQTPLEALKEAVEGVGLPRIVKSWQNAQKRMNNLGKLCGACLQYMDRCKAHRAAATAMGFLHYLRESEPRQGEGTGRRVHVSTWHGAKGLEWPVVVLASLDQSREATPFGARVVPASRFDPRNPLAGRVVRFWPWPFGAQKKFPRLDDRLAAADECRFVQTQAARESRRLLYVGMTRARDRLIFAVRAQETKSGLTLKTAWLDELSDPSDRPLIRWPEQEGLRELDIEGEKFPVAVKDFAPPEERRKALPRENEPKQFLSACAEKAEEFFPARVVPSALASEDAALSGVAVERVADFETRIPIRGRPDFAALGSAIHGFFAADDPRPETAARLLLRWGVEGAVDPADVAAAGGRLNGFVASRYPGARALREWPVFYQNEKLQIVQGWIDLLLELPEGYVLIDHKTMPHADWEHAKAYAPQLLIYKEAVEEATGKNVLAALLHLPVLGMVAEVRSVGKTPKRGAASTPSTRSPA